MFNTVEAGLRPADSYVDGYLPRPIPVETVDHSGESKLPSTSEIPISFPVDEKCVNELIRPGQSLGLFIPFFNDCASFVDDVLDTCRIEEDKKAKDE